ncbi:hypothetical protein LTR53_008032 [Teratosphaeriaceae sp. CCFEE 6253]|nr:hypothetical protein LTR53_008032 [Teratosphaeriaceae sp. CCFEE 6253]
MSQYPLVPVDRCGSVERAMDNWIIRLHGRIVSSVFSGSIPNQHRGQDMWSTMFYTNGICRRHGHNLCATCSITANAMAQAGINTSPVPTYGQATSQNHTRPGPARGGRSGGTRNADHPSRTSGLAPTGRVPSMTVNTPNAASSQLPPATPQRSTTATRPQQSITTASATATQPAVPARYYDLGLRTGPLPGKWQLLRVPDTTLRALLKQYRYLEKAKLVRGGVEEELQVARTAFEPRELGQSLSALSNAMGSGAVLRLVIEEP